MTWLAHSALLSLEGRTAVVTGGARGLGRGIADRLAEAGAAVAIGDLNADAARTTAAALSERWAVPAVGLGADVVDIDAVRQLGEAAVELRGGLEVWVNNAGIFPRFHPVTADRQSFERILSVNVVGTHLGCQVAADHIRSGVIVNIASTAAFRGAGAYSASKWAVRGITQGLAPRLGPLGIRVVAVAPTAIDTPGLADVRASSSRMAQIQDELLERLPLRRATTADDIARVVLFLASDAASMITGVTLPIDGGELTL